MAPAVAPEPQVAPSESTFHKIEDVIAELLSINVVAGQALATAMGKATPIGAAVSLETAIAQILSAALSAHIAATGEPFDLAKLQPLPEL